MIPIKHGIAVYFPVKILSIFSLLTRSLLSFGFTTVCSQRRSIKSNRISAIAATKAIEGDPLILEQLKLDQNELDMLEHIVQQMETEREVDRSAAKRTGSFASSAWSSIR